MKGDCINIDYSATGFFSKIVIDYLNQSEELKPFYKYPFSIEGIQSAIDARKKFPQQRELLAAELKHQYQNISFSEKLQQNIQSLLKENTFTVTTAHQPNIFTGSLYFIYKILHAIKLADHLSKKLPAYNFVPVYYMGSEDADLDEVGTTFINGEKYFWQTNQTGAVGRMKVDKAFTALLNKMQGQLGVEKYGIEIAEFFKKHYRIDVTIQQATLEIVNELFGKYGLVILIPDNANLKKVFNDVVKKELTEQFSHKAVDATITELQKHYKAQAGGRELNLFYLKDDKRERIEIQNSKFKIQNSKIEFSQDEISDELESHPERFSSNVILRGVFQETVLPNIAFIGGGGELAYWLELKKVFEEAGVPYPVLVLRNSFLLINQQQQEKINKLKFDAKDIFKDEQTLLNDLVKRVSANEPNLEKQKEQLKEFYQHIKNAASSADNTLQQHVEALQTQALKKIIELEKKMLRAERKKFEAEERQIHKLKSALFPENDLQERVENISGFYAKYGKAFIKKLLSDSLALEQKFVIVTIED